MSETDLQGFEGALPRRAVLKGAAWALPVVALAAATPAASASTTPRVDLASTARLPREARNGTHGTDSLNYYQGPRTLTFRVTYRNNGPDTLPAGGVIQFGLPFAAIWTTDSLAIIEDPRNMAPVLTGTSTMDISTETGPSAFRRVWSFVLNTEVPAGTSFDIVYRVNLTDTSNTATNFYRVRVYSNISVGASGAHETDVSNNTGYSEYAYFNNQNAG